MNNTVREASELMAALPDAEQSFALELIKRLVLAWDPDFTKVTAQERLELNRAREDEETIPHDMIDWD